MSLSEYAIMFVFVVIMGAGLPGLGDVSLIATGDARRWPGRVMVVVRPQPAGARTRPPAAGKEPRWPGLP